MKIYFERYFEFRCEKAKDVSPKLLKRYENEQIIAIFDPPGPGLHSKVIQALRRLLIKIQKSLFHVTQN